MEQKNASKSKRGIILINAYSNLPSALNQSQRLKSEFSALGIAVDVVRNGDFPLYADDSGKVVNGAADCDFCV